LSGEVLGVFPNFIPRTDEPNFQSVPEMVQELIGKRYYQTVKVDGSSGTIYKTLEHFGCCSRNLELKEKDNIAIWQIAKEYNLKENLPYNYALQFEMVGPGIQKNRLGLKKVEPRLFNIYDISTRKYLDAEQMFEIAKILNFPTVDIEVWDQIFEYTTDEVLRKLAEGEYSNGHKREGIVIRPMQETRIGLQRDRLSFKVINLLYKD
jgi:RNA ligase (TIGR02306 family)